MIIHNSFDSLYGGVNQQSAEHRNPTQVSEMINALPTIDKGLLKRNPTTRLELSESISFSDDMWVHEYDRGLSGDNEEQFSIQVFSTNNEGVSNDEVDMRIVNLSNGKVYTGANGGIVYDSESKDYLEPFIDKNGYAATTVKDTTFIANKNIIPELVPNDYSTEATPVDVTAQWKSIEIKRSGESTTLYNSSRFTSNVATQFTNGVNKPSNLAPCSYYVYSRDGYKADIFFYGAFVTLTIDGIPININTSNKTYKNVALGSYTATSFSSDDNYTRTYAGYAEKTKLFETISEYRSRIYSVVSSSLSSSLYKVEYKDDATNTSLLPLRITRLDGTTVSITISATFVDTDSLLSGDKGQMSYLPQQSDHFGSTFGAGTTDVTYTPSVSDIDKDGYIWIKSSNPTNAYNYTYTIEDSNGTIASGTITNTTTASAASTMAAHINTNFGADFSATSISSVVKVTALNYDMVKCEAGDDFGNTASFGWYRSVQTVGDLPANLGYDNALARVTGSADSGADDYWIKYSGGQWAETIAPDALYKIEKSTMPHILVRNNDDTFTFKEYDGWSDMKVGDSTTNPVPSMFKQTELQESPSIKDIFFFKNRLGIMTQRTTLFSEVGKYGNFFRTTVATLLDSDPIDAPVDTTRAISLEFATYIETSVILFSDKAQFRLKGGDILSPSNIQITEVSSHEINKNIRPLYLNDKLFFCAKRGDHTAVMEYFISDSVDKADYIDITAHVQSYIDGNIANMSGSASNNMLFISSRENSDTMFVYKFYDDGNTRVQSAWFKWQFNGTIYNTFSLGRNAFIILDRLDPVAAEDWVIGDGTWDDTKLWKDEFAWVDSIDNLSKSSNIEYMQIAPQDHTDTFLDDNREVEDSDTIGSFFIDGTFADDKNITRNSISLDLLQDVTIDINMQVVTGEFEYEVTTTLNTFTGDITADTTSVVISQDIGSVINNVTVRPKQNITSSGYYLGFDVSGGTSSVYNNDFSYGTTGWTINPSWIQQSGTKTTGTTIDTIVELGEWVAEIDGKKEIRGHLKMRTIEISSEDDSEFFLVVENTKRQTTDRIPSKYTVNRNPKIYGDAEDARITIESFSGTGFRINTVSLEGKYNIRSRRT